MAPQHHRHRRPTLALPHTLTAKQWARHKEGTDIYSQAQGARPANCAWAVIVKPHGIDPLPRSGPCLTHHETRAKFPSLQTPGSLLRSVDLCPGQAGARGRELHVRGGFIVSGATTACAPACLSALALASTALQGSLGDGGPARGTYPTYRPVAAYGVGRSDCLPAAGPQLPAGGCTGGGSP